MQFYLNSARGLDQYQSLVQEFYSNCNVQQLLFTLSYNFKDPQLLLRAFTHASFWNEWTMDLKLGSPQPCSIYGGNNERLEFLGDTIWSLLISTKLFQLYPLDHEGTLTQFRMALTNGDTLTSLSLSLGLSRIFLLGRGLLKNIHDSSTNNKLHENFFEALWASIYLDSDMETTTRVFNHFCDLIQKEKRIQLPLFDRAFLERKSKTPKTLLQEFCFKKFQQAPTYKILQNQNVLEQTPWEMALMVEEKCLVQKSGMFKKELENSMALMALEILHQSQESKGTEQC